MKSRLQHQRHALARTMVAFVLLLAAVMAVGIPVAMASPWTGSGGANNPSTSSVVSDGTSTPAQFTYHVPGGPPCCSSGSWTFQTTADTAGDVVLDWTYSGFHAYFEVTVGLTAFVTSGGVTTTTPLVSAGPVDCCTPPSAGFTYAGQVTLPGVKAGDTYGFVMTGGNADSNGTMTGTLTAASGAPALIRVLATDATHALIIGRLGANLASATVQAYSASSCSNGTLVGGALAGPPVSVSTSDGYFTATVPVAYDSFVAVQLTAPTTSALSSCLVNLGANDFWTTALEVGGNASVNDFIDTPGKTRWYKFSVTPSQHVTVSLTGLPLDYDLAVFKDIGAAFAAALIPSDAAALTKLSAEFAPSAFSPSAFSPSAFSPSAFSPSAFSPSAFSPSAFSPSVFSPSAFSPSAFSPSAFSPSAFSPSAFSPSAFSPSAFSPSAFSPSAFSPSAFSSDIINSAFSSAQTRSIIGVSSTPGIANEAVVVDSWNNSGYFYARVTGRDGAFSTTQPFTLSVAESGDDCSALSLTAPSARAPFPGNGITTVVLTDRSSFDNDPNVATMLAKLGTLPSSTIVDVSQDARVQSLKTQAANKFSCPFATNLVAQEIKAIVDAYRANNPLRFVVIAGGDDAVPFFRYPDESLLGEESGYVPPVMGASDASLRNNYVLSQDAYGSATSISVGASDFPIPGLAVGRLVKTPLEISGLVDAYTAANGVVSPRSSLVTGYDFLADSAHLVATELQAATNAAPLQLITANGVSPQSTTPYASGGPWTAADLHAALLDSGHRDVVYLAGHFNANSALAADFATNLITSDLQASTTDFTNTIVFSAGCHSGYSIVSKDAVAGVTFTLDWAQAFAQKKATLIAGTGYQYGDTDFVEYSERLYLDFAKELHAGFGSVPVGQALVRAKLDYLAATPDLRGLHKKALLESTLYGLPMLGINMPAGRGGTSGGGGAITATGFANGPAATLMLKTADLSLAPTFTTNTLQLTGAQSNIPGPLATWLSGPDGVVTNPGEPALPLDVVNVTPTDAGIVLRGVGFRGGSYTDSVVTPLTGAPGTEIRGVHTAFASPVFFPMREWTVNYFGSLGGTGTTNLLVTPAQHQARDLAAGTATLRRYDALALRLYYSGLLTSTALSDAPTILSVATQPGAGGIVTFIAQVIGDPAAAIQEVWATYTTGADAGGHGSWMPVPLAQCVGAPLPTACGTTADSRVWMGTVAFSGTSLQYVVQAANGIGLVSLADNRGSYYRYTVSPAVPAPTVLAFDSVPGSAAYGDAMTIVAKLSNAGAPVSGAVVTVNIAGVAVIGMTGADGRATLHATVTSAPGNSSIVASYGGSNDGSLAPSTVSSPFTVNKAAMTLATLGSSALGVTVSAPVVANGGTSSPAPVAGASVSFLLNGAGGATTVVVATDAAGNATLPTSGLAPGTYSATASALPAAVGSIFYYTGASIPLQFTLTTQSLALTAPSTLTYAPPGTFSVTASVTGPSASQPIFISSGTPLVCTVSGSPAVGQTSATVTIVAPGNCILAAYVAGVGVYLPAQARATVAISAAAQTIAAPPSTLAYLQSATLAATTNAPASQPITYVASGNCSIAGNVVTATSGSGTCTIGANAPGTTFYRAYSNASFATITLQKIAQVITFPAISTAPTFVPGGTGTFPVSASALGGAVTFSVPTTTAICSVSGSTVTMKAAGMCTIQADQPGNANYLPAPPALQNVSIARAAQTLTFAAPSDRALGTSPFALQATASSGLTVTFAVSTASVCTLSPDGVTLSLIAPGRCTVTASQAGNGNFNPASPTVARTFTVYLTSVAGLNSITMSGNATVDSYDSIGTYTATKGAQADVLSNGPVTVASAFLYGNLVSATDQVTVSGNGLVSGDVTAGKAVTRSSSVISGTVTPNHPLPAIVAPAVAACSPFNNPSSWVTGSYTYDATRGNLTVNGGNTVTIASGTHCLNAFTVSNGASVRVSGPVQLNLTGALTVSGNSTVNATQPPSSLQILSSFSGGGVTVSGGSTAYLAVYAPGSDTTVSGNSVVYGALVGKSVTISGSAVHYDLELLRVWGPVFGF